MDGSDEDMEPHDSPVTPPGLAPGANAPPGWQPGQPLPPGWVHGTDWNNPNVGEDYTPPGMDY